MRTVLKAFVGGKQEYRPLIDEYIGATQSECRCLLFIHIVSELPVQ